MNYFANGKNFTVLARDGKLPCVLQLAYGMGKIILVGFNYYLTSKDNYKFFNNIFEKFNIIPYYCWISENDSKVNIFRRTSKNGTFLFVTNCSEDTKVVKISYLDEFGTTRKLYVSVRGKGNSILQSNISVTRSDGKSVGRYISDTGFEFEYLPREDFNPYVFVEWSE